MKSAKSVKSYGTYEAFWPFYLSQHQNKVCLSLHFLGTTLALLLAAAAVFLNPVFWYFAPVAGYGFAWIGHFFFEKNRPATFQYPLWSLRGDFRLYRLTWIKLLSRVLSSD